MAEVLDLVVVGAGPAGLMAAKTAAQKGLSVALIERKQDVSICRRACCAQFIMDDDYEQEALQVSEGQLNFPNNGFSVRYQGQTLGIVNKYYYSPKGHRVHFAHPDGRPLAVKFDKSRLLSDLAEDTAAAGVQMRMGTQAFCGEDRGDNVRIDVVHRGKKSQVMAKKAIVADGVNAHITNSLGLCQDRHLFAVALVGKYIVDGIEGIERDSWNLYYGRAYHSQSAVLLGPSLYGDQAFEITAMGNAKLLPENIFHNFSTKSPLAKNFANARVVDQHGCAVRAYSSVKKPYKGNVIAIGDSAAYVEVEVQGALMCGHRAGQAVVEEIDGQAGFSRYTNWWIESFEFNGADHLRVAQGYALVPTYTDDELDYLFSLAKGVVLEGTYSQYKTPRLMWDTFLKHQDKIENEMPQLHEKVKRLNDMTLSGTF